VTKEIPDDLFEIQDAEVDPNQILQQIRERIARRREEKGYEERRFPVFGMTGYVEPPADLPYDAELYSNLRLANEAFARIETGPVLAPSPATRAPVVGRLWQQVRGEVHNLVLFYVNRAVTQQVNVNRYLVAVVNRLTALSQEQQQTIARLEAELDALKSRDEG
jgi:hypothetical protein